MALVVTAPLAYVRTSEGTVSLHKGASVPDGADEVHVELLTRQGVLGEPETPARRGRSQGEG